MSGTGDKRKFNRLSRVIDDFTDMSQKRSRFGDFGGDDDDDELTMSDNEMERHFDEPMEEETTGAGSNVASFGGHQYENDIDYIMNSHVPRGVNMRPSTRRQHSNVNQQQQPQQQQQQPELKSLLLNQEQKNNLIEAW